MSRTTCIYCHQPSSRAYVTGPHVCPECVLKHRAACLEEQAMEERKATAEKRQDLLHRLDLIEAARQAVLKKLDSLPA